MPHGYSANTLRCYLTSVQFIPLLNQVNNCVVPSINNDAGVKFWESGRHAALGKGTVLARQRQQCRTCPVARRSRPKAQSQMYLCPKKSVFLEGGAGQSDNLVYKKNTSGFLVSSSTSNKSHKGARSEMIAMGIFGDTRLTERAECSASVKYLEPVGNIDNSAPSHINGHPTTFPSLRVQIASTAIASRLARLHSDSFNVSRYNRGRSAYGPRQPRVQHSCVLSDDSCRKHATLTS